jgi:NarL family two-component system response regulator LiaR
MTALVNLPGCAASDSQTPSHLRQLFFRIRHEPPSTRRKDRRDNAARRGNIGRVKRTILLYGLLGGVLIAGLKLIEYRFLVVEHSIEIYGGIVALLFALLGIWLGLKLTRTREIIREVPVEVQVPVEVPVRASEPFVADAERIRQLGITPREMEILEAIAAGLSTREIAAKLFVSENTVKTHSSRLFQKLNASRRTQAVQIAKEAGLIP